MKNSTDDIVFDVKHPENYMVAMGKPTRNKYTGIVTTRFRAIKINNNHE